MDKIILSIVSVLAIGSILGMTVLLNYEEDKGKQIMSNNPENISDVMNPSITVIFDNYPYKEGLKTAWGFSCLIRGIEKTILFDTGGDGSILLENMKKLNIDPKEIELIVFSHIHGDHTGGLRSFLEKNHNVTVYLPESFPDSFKSDAKKYGITVVEVQKPVKICENVYSTGELGISIIEQSLIIQTGKGLIIITGCAHPGIVKIIKKAKDVIKDDVLFVMGGFHLSGESKAEIENIIFNFRQLGVRYAAPTHCSGDNAKELFEKEYRNNFINIGAGKVITMEDLK